MKSGMYSDYLGLTFEHPPGDWRHGVTLTGIEATARPLGTPQRQNGLAIADYDNDGWEDWNGLWHDFPNWREEEAMTDPWDADSDDDGMSDGYEADN